MRVWRDIAVFIAILTFCCAIVFWFDKRFDDLESLMKENHSKICTDFDQLRREIETKRTLEEMKEWVNRLQRRVEEHEMKLQ